jgi:hypothetical protein
LAQADNAGIADLSIGYQVVAQMINPLEPDLGSIQFKPVAIPVDRFGFGRS